MIGPKSDKRIQWSKEQPNQFEPALDMQVLNVRCEGPENSEDRTEAQEEAV